MTSGKKYHPQKKRYRPNESDTFRCKHCKKEVSGESIGTRHRNHCPYCLYSLHVDIKVGDRRSECHSQMKPIGLTLRPDGEIVTVHRCLSCGKVSLNRIAGDDNPETILSLVNPKLDIQIPNIDFVTGTEDVLTQLYGRK